MKSIRDCLLFLNQFFVLASGYSGMGTQPQCKTNQDPINILQLLHNEAPFYHFYIETEYFKMCRIMLNIFEILCFLHVTQIIVQPKIGQTQPRCWRRIHYIISSTTWHGPHHSKRSNGYPTLIMPTEVPARGTEYYFYM